MLIIVLGRHLTTLDSKFLKGFGFGRITQYCSQEHRWLKF
uniref:Uncharacterized protein n=1 Tax=Anguilla anguilla TaxID=7936 RepID=A0A0E9R9G1_ANGAN